MASKSDKAKRTKLQKSLLKKLQAASDPRLDVVLPDKVRKSSPALADVLDEFILSKSYRTDPKTTAKQVAEVIIASDQNSKLANLLSALEKDLKKKPKK